MLCAVGCGCFLFVRLFIVVWCFLRRFVFFVGWFWLAWRLVVVACCIGAGLFAFIGVLLPVLLVFRLLGGLFIGSLGLVLLRCLLHAYCLC